MAHTDLKACNEALDKERKRAQLTIDRMRAEMARLEKAIDEMALKRAGIGIALEIALNT